jgi:hypothetical protein
VFDVAPDPPGHCDYANYTDEEVEAVKPSLQRVVFVPFLAEFLAHVRERKTPR